MKNLIMICFVLSLIVTCCRKEECIEKKWHKNVQRIGMVAKLKKEKVEEYKKLHADNNAGVRHLLTKYNMQNFSIFLVQFADGEWYEFGYYEYWGDDLEGDMLKLDNEPENKKWLELCDPMQESILSDQKGWKLMDRIYYNY